jgi:hypothetical protein
VTVLNETMTCPALTAVDELKDHFAFAAQPNVFSHSTQLIFHSEEESNSLISLYDATGRRLKQFNITTANSAINLGAELSPGIYFARAEQGGAAKTIRIIKAD